MIYIRSRFVSQRIYVSVFLLLPLLLAACALDSNDDGSSSDTGKPQSVNLWTWVSGTNRLDTTEDNSPRGIYGVQGIADTANVPGIRTGAISWTDTSGGQWLLGGFGYGTETIGLLNDLWRWDGSNWTWVSGSNRSNQLGVYGVKGTAEPANVPSARENAVSWIDETGDLWLFGGHRYYLGPIYAIANDLWRWDGNNWIWISGGNGFNQFGVYGVKGTADPANVPGAREKAVSWIDEMGDLWLFGGFGGNRIGHFNDLWRWDGNTWTWISGSQLPDQNGIYGAQGIAGSINVPGARENAISWISASGDLWLFGGYGYTEYSANKQFLNDLWRWDGNNWTWVSGSNKGNQVGIYGTKGSADKANVPSARTEAIGWIDASDDLWLFGGIGDDAGYLRHFNDLWRWDGNNWTWVSGSNLGNQLGDYGTKGSTAKNSVPGGRTNAISWIGTGGDLWLFGGKSSNGDNYGTSSPTNDLWRYGKGMAEESAK